MKKFIGYIFFSAAVLLLALTSETGTHPAETVEQCPRYTVEEAKALEDAVIEEDGSMTKGEEIWKDFVADCERGKSASVRVIDCYSDEETAYVCDIGFDGKTYTVTDYSEDEPVVKEYKYMYFYRETPASQYAVYDYFERYVLTNKKDVTWDEIEAAWLSSDMSTADSGDATIAVNRYYGLK